MSVRLGIIGCGRIAEDGHAPALRALGDAVEVVALADPSPERRQALATAVDRPDAQGFDDWKAMLANARLDAVTVAVAPFLHEPAILDAAQAGVSVICEKPLVATLEEADRVGEALERSDARLSVMHNWGYTRQALAVSEAIAAGRIGEVFMTRNESVVGTRWLSQDPTNPNWANDPAKSGGGVILSDVYHSIYQAEDETKSPVQSVFAATGEYGPDAAVEDTAAMVLRHENGAMTVILRCLPASGGGAGAREIHGTRGSIRFPPPDPKALSLIFRRDYAALRSLPKPAEPRPAAEIFEHERGEWMPLEGLTEELPWWDGIREVYARTFAAWGRGEEAPTDLAASRRCLEAIHALYTSAERGAMVTVADAIANR